MRHPAPRRLAFLRDPRLFVPLCLTLLACTSPRPRGDAAADELPASPPPAAEPGPLPDRGEFVDNSLSVPAGSRTALRAALGEPETTTSEEVPNRHVPGVTDTLFTLRYPDLTARFHHPGGGGDLLSMVEVSDNRHLRYPVIGSTAAEVDAAFGRPDASSDSSLTYDCTSCEAGDDPVELIVVDGEVRRVRFNYYVD